MALSHATSLIGPYNNKWHRFKCYMLYSEQQPVAKRTLSEVCKSKSQCHWDTLFMITSDRFYAANEVRLATA